MIILEETASALNFAARFAYCSINNNQLSGYERTGQLSSRNNARGLRSSKCHSRVLVEKFITERTASTVGKSRTVAARFGDRFMFRAERWLIGPRN